MSASSAVRYPAVPLVVHDPYFSIWSNRDTLTENWSVHWTGAGNGIGGCAFIDGKGYVFCGAIPNSEAMKQKSVRVFPTRTVYLFEAAGIELTLTFLTPSLLHKPDLLSRPVSYVIFESESIDGRDHSVKVYLDAAGDLCSNEPGDKVVWSRFRQKGLSLMSMGSARQDVLGRSGDNLRIDWGYVYLGIPDAFRHSSVLGSNYVTRRTFLSTGELPVSDDLDMPRAVRDGWVCMASVMELNVSSGKASSCYLLLAYDDVRCIEYMDRKLSAYWRRNGMRFSELLSAAVADFDSLYGECKEYDAEWMRDLASVGGGDYAAFCALGFRQAIGAHKLAADFDGTPLFFSKENFSNGCIATVDVTYPSAPLFLLAQPMLLKGMLLPILNYAESPRWRFPFAPHDLGTYPLANGQVYGGGERSDDCQMPVEECGNMLLLAGALFHFCGESDFIRRYWKVLTVWAEYLADKGYDPENQLCTDDFAGHLAHNTNLSLKAILALGAYSRMAAGTGDRVSAEKYDALARSFAERWVRDAGESSHFRLAFDQEGSWSQKYNLIWDRLLDLNYFPASVAEKEVAFYKTVQNEYGLPLDSRKSYTKLDWTVWSAALTGKREDFDALFVPLFHWMNRTLDRVPLTDWFDTVSGRQVGFQARSVLGGVFIPMMADEALRKKWLAKTR